MSMPITTNILSGRISLMPISLISLISKGLILFNQMFFYQIKGLMKHMIRNNKNILSLNRVERYQYFEKTHADLKLYASMTFYAYMKLSASMTLSADLKLYASMIFYADLKFHASMRSKL